MRIASMEKAIALTLGMIAVGLAVGLFYEAVSEIMDRRRYPPQGELVDIGGFRLHLNCMGQGTPTVVMDAGGGAPAITWGLVPSEIAKFTRVCTYDRAGLGWSDPNPRISRTSQQSVDELHLLLTKAGIHPPYILVGHSLGGVNMRLYASQYPEDGSKNSTMSAERFQQWASLQLDLTQLSSNSQHIIAEKSGHLIHLDQPELVISAVKQLIGQFKIESA
jgi:pimeloyl-ACP methyl ester carboxylesterase